MSQENVEIVRSILEPFKGIDVASIDLDDDGLREALGHAYSPDFELRRWTQASASASMRSTGVGTDWSTTCGCG
jgi:hypothetical protein